jgi:excinuclease ABC subunit B
MFQLQSSYQPAWDQPEAIKAILDAYDADQKSVTLLGATGTGKTFTMANVIQKLQKPTLVLSHNKTLAAQLATEFKHFFPNNAVHYFVSYFDYYQPESYLPEQGVYIEKEATINKEIEMYRLATMASLLSRQDVIVVASVSALYGLGQKQFFQDYTLVLEVGKTYEFTLLKRQLLKMQYKPVQSKIEAGMFDFRGELLDIYSSTEQCVYRCRFNEETLEYIEKKDGITFENLETSKSAMLWPATQYLQDIEDIELILQQMEAEMELRVKEFEAAKMFVEAERIKKRVMYDIRMIRETGFTNGIENYSLYFDRRLPGEAPNTIFDYFPDDMLLIADESHMSIPQLRAMPQADRSRKSNLIKYGFRLPSAIDHRPLRFEELEVTMGLRPIDEIVADAAAMSEANLESDAHIQLLAKDPVKLKARQKNHLEQLSSKTKKGARTLFVSATPAVYELELSKTIAQQVIRPTGLIDPLTYVYPKAGDYNILTESLDKLLQKKPHLDFYLDGYEAKSKEDLEAVFGAGGEEVVVDEQP